MWPFATEGRWRSRSVPKSMSVTCCPPSRAATDEHVLELQVAVDDARLVQGRQRLEHAAQQRLDLVDVRGARTRQSRAQRLRVDVEVADPERAVGLARVDARAAGRGAPPPRPGGSR